jgi:pimeloyl-ACP methyl ester carboxylesterase
VSPVSSSAPPNLCRRLCEDEERAGTEIDRRLYGSDEQDVPGAVKAGAAPTSCAQHVLVSTLEGIIAFDSIAAASGVKCPLLYVGTNTTYTDVKRFRELCPQFVTGQLVGCGHYFPIEVPEQLNAMVARFIQTNVAESAV